MWHEPDAPRIWRCPSSSFYADEALLADRSHADRDLARIAEEGFTGIWLGAYLYKLMRSDVFPELNDADSDRRVDSLIQLFDRARKHGLGVYLYFNDPVALPAAHPFWEKHADLRGVTLWGGYSLCTSTPPVKAFVRQAVDSTLRRLPGLAGAFLITACEALTHCWSKIRLTQGQAPPTCPRCREREPADLVLEILQAWSDARAKLANPPRIMAWNWEWAYWYPDPQAPITTRLPRGIELLVDMELGGMRRWRGKEQPIGEYSLAYAGPSRRLLSTHAAAAPLGTKVHTKIQINNTHELVTVPNIPVIPHLHAKLAAMTTLKLEGFLGAWSFGTTFTLNSHAVRLFMRDPLRYLDADVFMTDLARDYLGVTDKAGAVSAAWRAFAAAFANYPFSIPMLYNGPHNDGPARVLSLRFEGKPFGRSWQNDPPGDDPSNTLVGFTADEVADAFRDAADQWFDALPGYESALALDASLPDALRQRREQELSVARMIPHHLRTCQHVYEFHRERAAVMAREKLTAPCTLPRDARLLDVLRREIANAERALPLAERDARLGYHDDCGGHRYTPALIRAKIEALRSEIV